MTPPQNLHPVARIGAVLARTSATPRESALGGGAILLASTAVVGLVLMRLLKRAMLD